MTPKDEQILIPGTCESVMIERTREMAVLIGLGLMFLVLKIGKELCRHAGNSRKWKSKGTDPIWRL